MYFYGIASYPPAIVEYDMTDPENVIINKIYTVENTPLKRFGHKSMAVNNNYLLHLLEEPDTGKQIIRIYSRQSNLLSIARYELIISRETLVDWFEFPNPFFNVLILRDERTMNVT